MSCKSRSTTHAAKISEGIYKDVRSLVLESDVLCVTILPDHVSKTASLLHKRTGVEHLYQLPGKRFRKAPYGVPYTHGESAGFDEMFSAVASGFSSP